MQSELIPDPLWIGQSPQLAVATYPRRAHHQWIWDQASLDENLVFVEGAMTLGN